VAGGRRHHLERVPQPVREARPADGRKHLHAGRTLSDQSTTFTYRLPTGTTLEVRVSGASLSDQLVTVRLPAGLYAVQPEARDDSGNMGTDGALISGQGAGDGAQCRFGLCFRRLSRACVCFWAGNSCWSANVRAEPWSFFTSRL
jgi:hypothetical protein